VISARSFWPVAARAKKVWAPIFLIPIHHHDEVLFVNPVSGGRSETRLPMAAFRSPIGRPRWPICRGLLLRARLPDTRSVGHRVDLPSAAALALSCCTRYRIPEPTRQADIEVAKIKAKGSQS
jgi:hypothetical protein